MTDRKQTELRRDEKGRITGGSPPNGFDKNPQNRHHGAWKKEDTLRFKIEKASSLDSDELRAIIDDPKEAMLVRRFAEATLKADWRMIKEISEMLYGKPKESVDISNPDGSMTPIVRIIDERNTDTK